MTANNQQRSGSQAIERAIQVLNCFEGSDPALTVSELAHLAGIPVSTAHRIAQALVRGTLLEQDPATDRYRIGHGLASLARPAIARLGIDSAAPHIYALAAGIRITVSLSIPEDNQARTVLQARPPVLFCHHQLPRARQSLHSSATGRALLAFSPALGSSAGSVTRTRPERHNVGDLFAELDRVRRHGFAVEEIEHADPVRSVAVPVLGPHKQVWGALSVQARSARLTRDLLREIVPAMRHVAKTIGPVVEHKVDAVLNAAT